MYFSRVYDIIIIGVNMKKDLNKMDKPLLFLIIIFCLFGLIMVYSSSSVAAILRYHQSSSHFFIKQLIFMIISFVFGFIFILRIPTSKYKYLSWLGIIGINVVLALLLVYGTITNHVQSWFYIGPMSIQPSEFAKSIIIIFLACYYNSFLKKKDYKIFKIFIPVGFAAIAFFLTALQPDLGSAVIIAGITFFIFISLPISKNNLIKLIKISSVLLIILLVAVISQKDKLFNEEQLARLNYKEPCTRYMEDSGYQVCNGFIAINNGGLLGVGIGNSTQKYLYLPESHTDFIFAIIVEELGMVSGILVVVAYAILLIRILKIAKSSHNLRNSIICYGTFWYIALHVIINLCGVLGLWPLTGVPLPLLSYGGSHTMNILIMLFFVLRVSIENKNTEYKMELKKLAS